MVKIMPCYKPLTAYQSHSTGEIKFTPVQSHSTKKIQLPCGQCIGCRIAASSAWANRIMHEAQEYKQNTFITLTYDEEHLPKDKSIDVRHFQLFMKRLRKENKDIKIRFFHCGEYGEQTNRAHYHACIFNYDFPDKEYFSENNGNKLYTSEILNRLWGKGHTIIGSLTRQSAAYVARYIIKKINGNPAKEHYQLIDEETGEVTQLKPEYITMSRRPGIGHNFYQQYKNEIWQSDSIVNAQFKEDGVPKYYDKLLKNKDPELLETIKIKRQVKAKKHSKDTTRERLKAREICAQAKLAKLKRGL